MKPEELTAKRAELKRLILTLPPADRAIVVAAIRERARAREARP